jgi:gluconolactonase
MGISILASDLKFPEGPIVTRDGQIFFVELLGGVITEYSRHSKTLNRFNVGGAPNGLMMKNNETLLFCDAKNNAIRSLNLVTGETKTIANQIDGIPLRSPNDLIQDSNGTVLFTCPGGSQKEPIGYLCALNKQLEISVIAEGMFFPNGLLLINDEKNIIINETWQHRILIGDWNKKTTKIENIRTFYHIGGHAEPDGLALSRDNLIYAAVYNTGMIWVFDTDGKLKKQIKIPGNCPTNLCFDFVGDLGLLVTEAEKGMLLSIK